MLEMLTAIGGIILVDLALSGDNALVIGAAAAGLSRRQQRTAIIVGGGAAIVLRVALGIAATLLLRLPLLQAIGGAVLVLVAIRLLAGHLRGETKERAEGEHATTAAPQPAGGLVGALLTILIADVTMSLDNVLAVGSLAAGNIPVLAGGLLLSMVILLAGSAVVARLIERLPWLVEVAALVLGWTAAQMILHDARLSGVLGVVPLAGIVVPGAMLGVVLLADVAIRLRPRLLGGKRREGLDQPAEGPLQHTPEMTRQPSH